MKKTELEILNDNMVVCGVILIILVMVLIVFVMGKNPCCQEQSPALKLNESLTPCTDYCYGNVGSMAEKESCMNECLNYVEEEE